VSVGGRVMGRRRLGGELPRHSLYWGSVGAFAGFLESADALYGYCIVYPSLIHGDSTD
jgi:hypothetical protein